MFVIAASRILEGERDSGEQTLATPTLQRSHVLRGVVIIVFTILESARCEKYVFECAAERWLIHSPDA